MRNTHRKLKSISNVTVAVPHTHVRIHREKNRSRLFGPCEDLPKKLLERPAKSRVVWQETLHTCVLTLTPRLPHTCVVITGVRGTPWPKSGRKVLGMKSDHDAPSGKRGPWLPRGAPHAVPETAHRGGRAPVADSVSAEGDAQQSPGGLTAVGLPRGPPGGGGVAGRRRGRGS